MDFLTVGMWVGYLACFVLTIVGVALSTAAFIFSGWDPMGGGRRDPWDWWLPIILTTVFALGTLAFSYQV